MKHNKLKDESRMWVGVSVLVLLVLTVVLDANAKQSQNSAQDNAIILAFQDTSNDDKLVTMRVADMNLSQALEMLAKRLNVGISYKKESIPDKRVSLNMANVPVFELLFKLLENTKLEPVLPPSQDVIVIREKKDSSEVVFQETVSGQIMDAQSGETLPGVNIVVQGTSTGTVTDSDGFFELTVPDLQETLVITYIGYTTQEVNLEGRTQLQISLVPQVIAGDELVVVGYGVTRRADLTGSVSSVNTEDLANLPNSRVDQILQGRSAGVQVTQESGAPGAGTVIRVRGGNSIVGNNEPLWVIDGVIVGQDFNLNNINSNDIESIEILKDASSVAIYGNRGSNGVILVTTKGGGSVSGAPEVNIGFSTGVQQLIARPDYMNAAEHVAYANEDASFRNVALPFSNPDAVTDTDWYDMIVGPAPIRNADVSIAGGSEDGNVNYYVSTNYFDQRGIVTTTGIEKFTLRSNLDFNLSDKFAAGFRLNYSQLESDNGTVGYGSAFKQRYLPVRDDNGDFAGFDPVVGSPTGNPVANELLNTNETSTTNFLGTFYLEYTPGEKWLIRSTFNPELNNSKTNVFNSSQLPNRRVVGEAGDASIRSLNGQGWNTENTIQFISDIGSDHRLNVLGGFSFQSFEEEISLVEGFGITNDATQYHNLAISADPTRNSIGSNFDGFQLVSLFGRINYSWKDRYLFTLVGRRDGSSRFAEGNKYAFFPSVAAAWRLSNEPFIQELGVFDDLKLRVSYGESGSQAIQSYRTLATMVDASTTFNGQMRSGALIGRPANPDLKWETTRQLDIGLAAEFFAGRLFVEFDYYEKTTRDLLLEVRVPRQTSSSSQLQNLGVIENKGLEMMANAIIMDRNNFNWSSTLTLSGNRNKVVDLGGPEVINVVAPNGQSGPGGRLILGQPAPVFTGVNYLGTWKSQDEIDASGQSGQVVGGARFDDPNGDGVISFDEFYVLGSPEPDFIYGLRNNFRIKDFDFSFFIQGTKGNEVSNSRTLTSFFGRMGVNKYKEVVNRYSDTNTTSDIPRAGAHPSLGEIPNNSEFIEDGSHLRLKSVRLAYNLPVQRMGIDYFRNLTVYFSGTNLFVLSDFRLKDPEASTQFNEEDGNVDFPNVAVGFNGGEYPNPRILTFGINVSF